MMENGIETYTTSSYTRLSLDKHIRWHRAIDKIANALVGFLSAIVYIGPTDFSPNSPISIRKHMRCPGLRKLIGAFKKRSNVIIRLVDEWMTSQHCAKCFKRFLLATKSMRFKKCDNCLPNPIVRLPTSIVTNVSKRMLQMQRAIMKVWNEMSAAGNAIAAALSQPENYNLVPKKQVFLKTWTPNVNNGGDGANSHKSVWHRDITAAKCILYKGIHTDFN